MKVKNIGGEYTTISSEVYDRFTSKLKGPVLFPGDNGYEDSRTVWNAMIDRHPAFIVRCLGTADVVACVRFARENNLLISVKDGGHNIAGLAVADGAIMLDMSLMRGVWVYPPERIAHVQSGCLISDVDRETQIHGLATVLGFISQTGVTGLTLGGGFGYLTRRWGWTSDNVRTFSMVTADGNVVRASAKENTDLFWALRGGGGNFGIVTGIDYMLYPVGPEILGGVMIWPASEAMKVLEFYMKFTADLPPELTLVAIMRPAPPTPLLPPSIHGKMVIMLLACYSGNPVEGERLLAPVKSLGQPLAEAIVRQPYLQLQSSLDIAQPKGRRYYWKSEYLSEITGTLCEKFITDAEKINSPFSALILFQLGGALNRLGEEHSAAGNRETKFLVNITGSWEKNSEDESNIKWVRDTWEDMKPFSTGGNYVNFQTSDEDYSRIEASYGQRLPKLIEVKSKWDPENFFRVNRNIRPDFVVHHGNDKSK